MAKTKLDLDDEGFEVLGNALLLGYAVRLVERRDWPESDEKLLQERVEYSERSELRDALESAGAVDPRLTGDRVSHSGLAGVSHQEVHREWQTLADSEAPIARLRLRDIDFQSYLPIKHELLTAIENADRFELRKPLARLGPTELTRDIKVMVLEYYSGDTLQTVRPSSPIKSPKQARKTKPDIHYDPAINEGVRLIFEGDCPRQPHSAARMVVERWGVVPQQNWSKGCRKVPGVSIEAAEITLARKIGRALKEQGKHL